LQIIVRLTKGRRCGHPTLFKAFISPTATLYLRAYGTDLSYGAARLINNKLSLVGLFFDTKFGYADASVLQLYNGSTSYALLANYELNDKATLTAGGTSTKHRRCLDGRRSNTGC
jgi:hypothetical protein